MEQTPKKNNPSTVSSRGKGLLIKLLIPVILILLALGFLVVQIKTRPRASQEKPPVQARLVTVENVECQDVPALIAKVSGIVIPSREIDLSPEVSGRVTWVSDQLVPGASVQAGDVLVTLDDRNYQAEMEQQASAVASAQLALELELGQQAVVQHEYALLQEEIPEQDRALVLREPQLAEARAVLKAAQAAYDKARLDVQRCVIKAPFNAVIQEKNVDLGAYVTTGSSLLSLTGTDVYWVKVAVPVLDLKWVEVPEQAGQLGSEVRIYDTAAWDDGVYRTGHVIRCLGDLESDGRMARLLVQIDDPLGLTEEDQPTVLLNSYVRAEVMGCVISDVVPLAPSLLRDGHWVWVMDANDSLHIQPVTLKFSGRKYVCVSEGLNEGDRIVVTDIAAPIEGMPLRVSETEDAQ